MDLPWFTHWKWWFSIVFLYVYQRVSGLCHLRGKGWKRGVGNSSSVCKLDIWDGWTFQSWYGPEKTFSRKGMVCCKHGLPPSAEVYRFSPWMVCVCNIQLRLPSRRQQSFCLHPLRSGSSSPMERYLPGIRGGLQDFGTQSFIQGFHLKIASQWNHLVKLPQKMRWSVFVIASFPQLACCHSRKISFPSFEYISPNNLRTLRFPIRTYDKIWSNLCSKKIDPSQPQLISVQPLAAICFSNATRYSGQAKMPGFSCVT